MLMTRVSQSWDKVEDAKKQDFLEFISKKVESSLEGKDIKLQEWREFKYEIINNIYSGEKPKQAEEGAEAKKAAAAKAAAARRAAAAKKTAAAKAEAEKRLTDVKSSISSRETQDINIDGFNQNILVDLLLLRVEVLKPDPKIKTDAIIGKLSEAINDKLEVGKKVVGTDGKNMIPKILYKAVKLKDGKWKSFIKWFKKNIFDRTNQEEKEKTTREQAAKLVKILNDPRLTRGVEYTDRINRNVLNRGVTQREL
jgi:hypothetical protein